MTLKQRIVIPFLLLFLTVLTVTAITAVVLVSRAVESRMMHQMQDLASFLSKTRGFPLNPQSLEHIKSVYNAELLIRGEKTSSLTTLVPAEVEEFLRWFQSAHITQGPSTVTEIRLGKSVYQMVHSPITLEGAGQVLYLFFPGRLIADEQAKTVLPLILTAFVSLILVTVLGFLTAHKISEPISQLAHSTQRIASGQFDLAVPGGTGITELNHLSNSFRVMLEGLRKYEADLLKAERLAVMGHMALGVAHEIRNPLTSIKMNLQMLASDKKGEERETYQLLLKEVERLELAVSELLSTAHPSKLKLEMVDIHRIAAEVMELLERQLEHLSVRVEKQFASLPWVEVDVNRFKRVVLNLILNGAQAMPRGGKLTLKTQSIRDGTVLRFSVQDEGQGIPVVLRDKVFEPLVTTKQDGVGIGLSVTKRIVEEHGGQIGFETSDTGTTFWVDLPLKSG